MKTPALALVVFLSLAVCGVAADRPAPGASKAAPKASGAAPAAAVAEKEPVIEGYVISRKAGGYLGLEVVDGNFKVSFYDEKKKPVDADVARGSARWNPPQKTGSAFSVLNPAGDGKSLVGNKFVRPPLNFLVFITLLNAAGESVETYPGELGDREVRPNRGGPAGLAHLVTFAALTAQCRRASVGACLLRAAKFSIPLNPRSRISRRAGS